MPPRQRMIRATDSHSAKTVPPPHHPARPHPPAAELNAADTQTGQPTPPTSGSEPSGADHLLGARRRRAGMESR